MTLKDAKSVFAHLMQVARTRELRDTEKRTLTRARQTLRQHAKPVRNAPVIGQCQCADSSCPVHKGKSHCTNDAVALLRRVDMMDSTGTKMCLECADDALESGLFSVVRTRKNIWNVKRKKNQNYGRTGMQIYGRCLRIEAIKTNNHTYGGKATAAGQRYYHDFTTKNAKIYGLPNGDLLISTR